MNRPYNFSAGPAAMPTEVLQQAAIDMMDWQGSGMGVMEMSHRGKEFTAIAAEAGDAKIIRNRASSMKKGAPGGWPTSNL